jgi:NADPH-dependent curcumin reductase CurA
MTVHPPAMTEKNVRVLLASRPVGAPKESDFRLEEAPVPTPGDGHVLVRNLWLSLDPYMRGRMNAGKSYAAPVELGAVMLGGTVGEVLASKHPRFAVGDAVVGPLGWQTHALSDGAGLLKLKPAASVPLSAYLGAVGMPGVTAWYGLHAIGAPKAGETLVVAAATGAVGSVVGQLAKHHGCRVVGIAGGPEKCDYAVRELGFDVCLDHRAPDLAQALRDATPAGVDIYFENVGGPILDLVLARLNPFARVPLCGLISDYNATEPYRVRNLASLLVNRVTLRGFIISDHMDVWPKAMAELAEHVASGRLTLRESVTEGLASAPAAFIGLLEGKNFGKALVKLG